MSQAASPTAYTYDANGNLIESTYPMGYFTSYAYNAKNELCWGAPVAVSSPACAPAPAPATVYTYDALLSTTLVEHDPGIWRYVGRARRDVHCGISTCSLVGNPLKPLSVFHRKG